MKLFMSVALPCSVMRYLIALQDRLREAQLFKGTYTDHENFHITVIFLGERSPDDVPHLIACMQKIPPTRAPVTLKQWGSHTQQSPHVVWVPIESPGLNALADHLNEALCPTQVGKRPFFAHVTLARIKQLREVSLLDTFLDTIRIEPFCFVPTVLTLKQSCTTADGVFYKDLYSQPLNSNS